MASTTHAGPYKLLTVNNAPARAKLLIGRVTTNLKDRYTIEHAGNCISKDEIEEKVKELHPDIICGASMWTPEEAKEMHAIARAVIPGIEIYAIPQGLQVNEGPDAVVAHLEEAFPKLLSA